MAKKALSDFDESSIASRPVTRRIVAAAMIASALTACLMSIDESKLDPGGDDGDSTGRRDAASNPYVPPPPVRDAEAPITGDDGSRTCSAGLTLCPDDVCYDTTGEPKHCGSCTMECPAGQTCRSSACVAPSSCRELLATAPGTATGVATLAIGGATVPVYCDMTSEGGGYSLVYRLTGGIPGDPYALFEGSGTNDTDPAEATPLPTTKHYVSRLLGMWGAAAGFPVTDVRVRLYNASGQVLRELKFNGAQSSRESWYSKGNLSVGGTPWFDIANAATNVFTPGGHEAEKRAFLITKPYPSTGCPDDEGWLVVHGTLANPACDYEKPMPNIKIYYAAGFSAQKWSTGMPQAASFAIFAR